MKSLAILLLLVLGSFCQDETFTSGKVPSRDVFTGDPYQDDVAYKSSVKKVQGMLAADNLHERAKLEIVTMLKKFPASPILNYELGCAQADSGDLEDAIKSWDEAVFADDGASGVSIRSLEGIAAAQTKLGRKKESANALERAVKCAPLSYRLRNRLAAAYDAIGEKSKSRSALESSLRLNPVQKEVLKKIGSPAAAKKDDATVDIPALIKEVRQSVLLVKCGDSHLTGFVAFSAGTVITCAHGVPGVSSEVEIVYFSDEKNSKSFTAKVAVYDDKRDIAILCCGNLPKEIPLLRISDPRTIEQGEKVITVGNPGLADNALTLTPSEGIVAAGEREVDGRIFVQCNMAVNGGNSGGPLIDKNGKVIGVISMKSYLEGVAFAIPIAEVPEMFSDYESLHPAPGVQD